VLIGQRFRVLHSLVWSKPPFSTKAQMFRKSDLRSYFPVTERIIFAEHFGADNMAKGEAGYAAKCDELRGFVFEPLRAYLAGERDRAGISNADINEAWCRWKGVGSTSQTQKWFSNSCFNPPTQEAYEWLREMFNRKGSEYLRREYEDLRTEYEDLRTEYEDLRRPFSVTAEDQFTDVWTFPTVSSYPGKHPCEKPASMLDHIIKTSSRPGATVLDPFMGSGSTLLSARHKGRKAIGIEKDERWCEHAARKLDQSTLVAA
jgi:site-specific DNA-methyltransferase (adenine-specific)